MFVLLGAALSLTKKPWSDEGVFANSAYNLAFRGFTGANVVEPSGHFLDAYLSGVQERMYLVLPGYLVAAAGWFKLFGFSSFVLRSLSIAWGIVALLALYLLVDRLCRNRNIALLAVALTATDFTFLWSAADGRMDMMTAALGYAGLGAYLLLRERNLNWAMGLSQCLVAAGCFTHPNGALAEFGLLYLAWFFDRRRLKWSHLALAVVPYLVLAAAWGVYILQSPADFKAQFFANAAGRGSDRWMNLLPWRALELEILVRYIAHYGAYPVWAGSVPFALLAVPVVYGVAFFACLLSRKTRAETGNRTLLVLTALYFTAMTLLVGMKVPNYLVLILPLHNAVLALWACSLFKGRLAARTVAAAAIAIVMGIQLYTVSHKVRLDTYRNDYTPAIAFVRNQAAAHRSIYGTAALGFGLGFDSFIDDSRLGYWTHKIADVVVVDEFYARSFRNFATDEPRVRDYVVNLLDNEYRLAHESGTFRVYVRR